MPLSNSQRRYLRGLAHALHPVVMIGDKGLTAAVQKELDLALLTHELVKVRINAPDRQTRDGWAQTMLSDAGAQSVQQIGHVLTMFRANPDEPKLALPR
jgi:RNA-binding protein